GRWMRRRAELQFTAPPFKRLVFQLVTHIPDVTLHPLQVEIALNHVVQQSLSISDNEPHLVALNGTELREESKIGNPTSYRLEIKAGRTWQPRPNDALQRDDRDISVAVFDIRLEW
ncbi:MAG TPA: hypothetical protein VIV66_15990, partial [Pyrinomonadaceae bacterium]